MMNLDNYLFTLTTAPVPGTYINQPASPVRCTYLDCSQNNMTFSDLQKGLEAARPAIFVFEPEI